MQERVGLTIKGKGQEGNTLKTPHPDGGSNDAFQAWIKQQAQVQQEELGDGKGSGSRQGAGVPGAVAEGHLLEIDLSS